MSFHCDTLCISLGGFWRFLKRGTFKAGAANLLLSKRGMSCESLWLSVHHNQSESLRKSPKVSKCRGKPENSQQRLLSHEISAKHLAWAAQKGWPQPASPKYSPQRPEVWRKSFTFQIRSAQFRFQAVGLWISEIKLRIIFSEARLHVRKCPSSLLQNDDQGLQSFTKLFCGQKCGHQKLLIFEVQGPYSKKKVPGGAGLFFFPKLSQRQHCHSLLVGCILPTGREGLVDLLEGGLCR